MILLKTQHVSFARLSRYQKPTLCSLKVNDPSFSTETLYVLSISFKPKEKNNKNQQLTNHLF